MPCQLSNKSELQGAQSTANKMIQIITTIIISHNKIEAHLAKSYMREDFTGTSWPGYKIMIFPPGSKPCNFQADCYS